MQVHELRNIDVHMISLVKAGANGKAIILKRDAVSGVAARNWTVPVRKYDEAEGIVYGIVYSPGEVDSQGDTATAEEIRRAAYGFMKALRAREIDKDHDGDQRSAYVCESWIVKEDDRDPVFPAESAGTWAVGIKLEDEALKEAVRKGEIAGLSMAGTADRVPLEKAAVTFNGAWAQSGLWEVLDALGTSLRSIMEDAEADKTAMIGRTFDEAKTAVLARVERAPKPAPPAGGATEKEEKLVEKVLKALRSMRKAEPPATPPAGGGEPGGGDPPNGDLAAVVEEGFQKLDERLTAIEGRVQAIEEMSKMSKQATDPLKKADEEAALGAEMAALVN